MIVVTGASGETGTKTKVTTTMIDPQKPNAPTDFRKFAEEVFVPVYKSVA